MTDALAGCVVGFILGFIVGSLVVLRLTSGAVRAARATVDAAVADLDRWERG